MILQERGEEKGAGMEGRRGGRKRNRKGIQEKGQEKVQRHEILEMNTDMERVGEHCVKYYKARKYGQIKGLWIHKDDYL